LVLALYKNIVTARNDSKTKRFRSKQLFLKIQKMKIKRKKKHSKKCLVN